jgi:hypothetical protein
VKEYFLKKSEEEIKEKKEEEIKFLEERLKKLKK